MKQFVTLFFVIMALGLSACSETRYAAHVAKQIPLPGDTPQTTGYFKVGNSYTIKGRRYYPRESYNLVETGMASWYGPNFHGKMTANGEIFNQYELTAAHRTLQMPSIIRVTNMNNGRSAILRVNDRGPFAHDRVLDVSKRAATVLGFKNAGTTKVRIEALENESLQVAHMAKNGQATTGFEVALNTNSPSLVKPPQTPLQKAPLPAQPVMAGAESALQERPPVLEQRPVFVQAGSFADPQNALSLSQSLQQIAPSQIFEAIVDNRPFYRVKLGPFKNKAEAEKVAYTLIESGNTNTKIVTD